MSLQSQVSFVWEGVDHGEDDGDVDQGEGGFVDHGEEGVVDDGDVDHGDVDHGDVDQSEGCVVVEDDLHLREGRQW